MWSNSFQIDQLDRSLEADLQDKINNLTKPKGSLGRLEELAIQIGLIQQSLCPSLSKPQNIIFAADHGVVVENVSKSPKEITWQCLNNFIGGGAGINFLCRQHGFELKLVDAGVDFDFPDNVGIIDKKIRKSTRNYRYEAALSEEEMAKAILAGADIVKQCYDEGTNVISFGEMGIANTSTSSLWMHYLMGVDLKLCVGAGSGLDEAGVKHKYEVLLDATKNYQGPATAKDILRYFGGLEMLMAMGAMLKSAELKMLFLVDGFIMSNCLLAAKQFYPAVQDYAVFAHCGDESGHKLLLDHLGAKPLLHLDLRLGEGSGAVAAYPIIDSAVRMINEMHSFAEASVRKYF